MSSLRTVFPGQAPKFEPHVTITTNILVDMDNAKDDVNRILSSCCIALQALPRESVDHDWVRLGRVASKRKFFKKLYFQVLRDPTLVSFARIVRELFVILPEMTEAEQRRVNPQLYLTDSEGNMKKKTHRRKSLVSEGKVTPLDTLRIQQELVNAAAEWSMAEFDPHLSLVYSDLHPIDTALWHTIRSRVLDYLSVEDCDLAALDVHGNGFSWEGGVLKLVLCEGDVKDWVVLGSVDLHI